MRQKWQRDSEPEEILQKHYVLIYPRPGYDLGALTLPPRVKAVHTPLLEISSTFIRTAIREGKDMRYFLHPEVDRLIKELHLYRK